MIVAARAAEAIKICGFGDTAVAALKDVDLEIRVGSLTSRLSLLRRSVDEETIFTHKRAQYAPVCA